MDRIFKSDEQAFISPITSVRSFYEQSTRAWNEMSDLLSLNMNNANGSTIDVDRIDDETGEENDDDENGDDDDISIMNRFAEFAKVSSTVAHELASTCRCVYCQFDL